MNKVTKIVFTCLLASVVLTGCKKEKITGENCNRNTFENCTPLQIDHIKMTKGGVGKSILRFNKFSFNI